MAFRLESDCWLEVVSIAWSLSYAIFVYLPSIYVPFLPTGRKLSRIASALRSARSKVLARSSLFHFGTCSICSKRGLFSCAQTSASAFSLLFATCNCDSSSSLLLFLSFLLYCNFLFPLYFFTRPCSSLSLSDCNFRVPVSQLLSFRFCGSLSLSFFFAWDICTSAVFLLSLLSRNRLWDLL